jgi:iron complex transport system ATP-binding protein
MNVLSLKNISAAPWGTPLLSGINLELDGGDILGVIGPNGAGKTSLLNMISGEIRPSQGTISLLGTPLADWDSLPRAKVLATLPQLSLLNFPYTVEEVIMLGRNPHSTGINEDKNILQEVMVATDTTCLRDRIYTQLSGGEKQRVQLARVFSQIWHDESPGSKLLLLDEPTAALDLAHQQLILETLRGLAKTGCAIVVVAHDFNLVAAIADQVIALRDGQPAAHGSPKTVLTSAIFSRVFDVDITVSEHPVTGRPLVISL